jgi:hypothetical protein
MVAFWRQAMAVRLVRAVPRAGEVVRILKVHDGFLHLEDPNFMKWMDLGRMGVFESWSIEELAKKKRPSTRPLQNNFSEERP